MKQNNPQLQSVYEDYKDCSRCDLKDCRQKVVLGTGNPHADIMVITDTPSESEDMLGHYNTSDIRWFLNAFKHAIGKPDMPIGAVAELFFSNVFMTSAVACRPILIRGENAGDYRDPTWRDEIKVCGDRLQRTIYAVDPNIVIACGKFSVISLVKRTSKIPRRHGGLDEMFTFDIPGEVGPVYYSAIPTHDPSIARRRGDYDDPNGIVSSFSKALRTAWQINQKLNEEDI